MTACGHYRAWPRWATAIEGTDLDPGPSGGEIRRERRVDSGQARCCVAGWHEQSGQGRTASFAVSPVRAITGRSSPPSLLAPPLVSPVERTITLRPAKWWAGAMRPV